MANYLISKKICGTTTADTIHDVETKLRVKAINLLNSVFTPCKGEVRFFVTAGDERMAFETKGYRRHRKDRILHMISWYCVYAGLMETAIIHATWPN